MVGQVRNNRRRYPSKRKSKKMNATRARKVRLLPITNSTLLPDAEGLPDITSILRDIADLQLQGWSSEVGGRSLTSEIESSKECSPNDSPVAVLTSNSMSGQPKEAFTLTGRRIVDINHLLRQLVSFPHHGGFDCDIKYLACISEKIEGLKSKITLRCCMCLEKMVLATDDPSNMDINLSITSGMLAAGVGFSNMEEIMSAANVPFMSHPTFKKSESTLHDVLLETAAEDMAASAAKEAQLSRDNGEVDKDGVPLVTVISDGCWGQRSFKTKYDSLSGAAVIIGQRTKEVLFMGVKNKYCLVCVRAQGKGEEAKQHVCFQNWNQSSTSMEAALILEGFQASEELYGIRYNRLIADGDSSVYSSLVKNRPYKNTTIRKIECTNHLIRNLCRKITLLSETKNFGSPEVRRLVKKKVQTVRIAVNTASKYWNSHEDISVEERTESLRKDIKNAPYHIFGEHSKCATYFCKGVKEGEVNYVTQLKAEGLWGKLEDPFTFLSLKASSLLLRLQTNAAENFNSIVAKAVGGKRINYSLRGSYLTRCLGAVVAKKSKALQSRLHKRMIGRSPGKFTKLLEQRRIRKLEQNKSRAKKALFKKRSNTDANYGPTAMCPDLDEELFKKECSAFIASLSLSQIEIADLEQKTRDQSGSSLWYEERRKRLTASNFGEICKRRSTTKCKNIVERLLYKAPFDNSAVEYGRVSEPKALAILESFLGTKIKKCGFFVDEENSFLGASPDGMTEEGEVVEIKSPYKFRQEKPEDALKFLPYISGGNTLKTTHQYYYQVQGQMAITKREECWFVVYTEVAPFVYPIKVYRDGSFWKNAVEKLRSFYFDCILPELVDPRKSRSLKIREPYHRSESEVE